MNYQLKIGDIQLYKGDCLQVMPLLADNSVDAIICDLPYGTTSCSWDNIIPVRSASGSCMKARP